MKDTFQVLVWENTPKNGKKIPELSKQGQGLWLHILPTDLKNLSKQRKYCGLSD